ncbi:hypothetical protein ADK75_10680 [Streptomyces virginiae]|uniref:Transposase n=1 Tax=Streptomyces virginiae TaxID=1961 RepID=A0A0L8MYY8_STRVG|nr:hypothetical protein ADK75_10680 [Streptomyces virginiae]
MHSSWSSVRTAVARRLTAVGFGKTWTTSERRLISRFSRSSGLVDWIFFQWWCGKSANAVRSSFAERSISLARLGDPSRASG